MSLADVSFILGLVLKLFSAYFVVVMLFAVVKPKPFAKAAAKTRFAVVIAARNEQAVIAQLVHSLKKQDYPKDMYDIYVVPNNCTDDTRGEALRAGARVIDCRHPVKAKGDALRQAFAHLMPRNYDAFCVFDADNVVDPRFLAEMNNAFCAGARVAKGRNEAKNPHDSWIAGCYGIYFGTFNHFYNRGRAALGMSAKLVGTGFAVSHQVLAENGGWVTETIAEDAEFAADCALRGERVAWVPDAVAYDEEPNSFVTSLKQRRRWCSGIMQVSALKLPALAKGRGAKGRRLRVDTIMFLLAPFVQVLSFIPLAMSLVAYALEGVPGLVTIGITLAVSYLAATALAALVVTLSKAWNRRILKSVFTFAFFMASWLPLQMYSFVKKTTRWEEIRHTRSVPLEEVA